MSYQRPQIEKDYYISSPINYYASDGFSLSKANNEASIFTEKYQVNKFLDQFTEEDYETVLKNFRDDNNIMMDGGVLRKEGNTYERIYNVHDRSERLAFRVEQFHDYKHIDGELFIFSQYNNGNYYIKNKIKCKIEWCKELHGWITNLDDSIFARIMLRPFMGYDLYRLF